MTTEIQLAIQGGGARFAPLYVAANTILTRHHKQEIEIKKIAGTSAGAIVAGLICCNADFGKIQDFLSQDGLIWLDKIEQKFKFFWIKLLLKKPTYNFGEFQRFLQHLFEVGVGKVPETISEAQEIQNIQLLITASDIEFSKGKIFSPSDNFIRAIAGSCSIPFVFRTLKNYDDVPYVDGSLFSGLPSNCLSGDNIFAIYHSSHYNNSKNLTLSDYTLRLLAPSRFVWVAARSPSP